MERKNLVLTGDLRPYRIGGFSAYHISDLVKLVGDPNQWLQIEMTLEQETWYRSLFRPDYDLWQAGIVYFKGIPIKVVYEV